MNCLQVSCYTKAQGKYDIKCDKSVAEAVEIKVQIALDCFKSGIMGDSHLGY